MLSSQTLHSCHVLKLRGLLSGACSLCQSLALIAILYYRGSFFFNRNAAKYYMFPLLPWLFVSAAEFLQSFMWLIKQPLYWWPVTRTAYPERLPKDGDLPGIDVVICTADPVREPTFDVMNTVLSAMALDYPAQKLSVYLSDDGGSSGTLKGLKEAWVFATWWLPFCRRYNIKTICPKAYFQQLEEASLNKEFIQDRKIVQEKYEKLKQRVQNRKGEEEEDGVDGKKSARDHPALVQVVNAKSVEAANPEHTEMALLVYVAREKRPSHSHHFKAGALNVLLRVSSILTNAPYILFLDCDMYCNDPVSARGAMCFHLDPKISPELGWVQYPHKFHNTNESDIYDSQLRTAWQVLFPGCDGIQGPLLAGTNVYIKRKALYGLKSEISNIMEEQTYTFGASNEFINSLGQMNNPRLSKGKEISSALLEEAHCLASCTYEQGTKWGDKVGYQYGSVVEDAMTGFVLQSQGWKSVYLNPKRPQFLGSATTNLDVFLTQGCRWCAGLLQIGLSKYCPLIYRPSQMHFLQQLASSWVSLFPLDFIPVSCFAIVPPICFFYGIPIYPKVSDPFFSAFAFVFISSHLKHLCEFLISGGSVSSWQNEIRTTTIKAVTSYVYGTLEFIMEKLGIRKASFIPTNKAENDDTTKWYQIGKYDFRTSNMFLVPIVSLVTLNLVCFVGGVVKMIVARNWVTMLAQGLFSVYALVMSVPVVEGMVLRKDNGRVPLSTSLISAVLSMAFLSFGYFIFEIRV